MRASWWSRVGAWLIDGLLSVAPVVVVGLVTDGLRFGHRSPSGHVVAAHTAAWYVVLGIAVAWAYQLITQCRAGSRNGQTLGKQLFGIRVVRDDGRPYGLGTFVIRDVICKSLIWWSRFDSALTLPLALLALLDDFWPLWDGENRALHDYAARTHVLRV